MSLYGQDRILRSFILVSLDSESLFQTFIWVVKLYISLLSAMQHQQNYSRTSMDPNNSIDSDDDVILGWKNPEVRSIFGNPSLKALAAKISPRLETVYEDLSTLFASQLTEICQETLDTRADEIFSVLTYKSIEADSPICNKQIKSKGYLCFECNKINDISSIYCEECFDLTVHEGHYFIVTTAAGGLCDCGNKECMKSDSFCQKHRNFKQEELKMDDPEVEKYRKQMEFVMYILLRVKRQKANKVITFDSLWEKVFEMIKNTGQGSYLYQTATAQFLLKPLPKPFDYDSRPLIDIFFLEGWTDQALGTLKDIYLQLYSVKIARKKVVFQIIAAFNCPTPNLSSLQVLSQMFFQYFQVENVLVKLFQKKITRPIASYYPLETLVESTRFHRLVYHWYTDCQNATNFPQVVQQVILNTQIKNFFNVPANRTLTTQNQITSSNMFQEEYLKNIIRFVKAILKLQDSQQKCLLKKIVRECYKLIMEDSVQSFNCAERTFGLCLLVYFDFDLSNMAKLTLPELMDLFLGDKCDEKANAKVCGEAFSLKLQLILTNFQKRTLGRYQRLVPQKIVTSINYCFFSAIVIYLYAIDKEIPKYVEDFNFYKGRPNKQPKVVKGYSIFQKLVDEMSKKSEETVKKCNKFIDEASVVTAGGQNEFNSNLQLLNINGLTINMFIYGLLSISEGEVHQTVLANHLGRTDKSQDKTLQFYRELAAIHQEATISMFKSICDSWIDNEEVLASFFINQYENVKNKQTHQIYQDGQEYKSGLSYYSEYIGTNFSTEHAARLKMQLHSPRLPKKLDKILKYFLNETTCLKLLKFYQPIISVLNSGKVPPTAVEKRYFRYSVNLIVNLYIETRHDMFRRCLFKLGKMIKTEMDLVGRFKVVLPILEEQDRQVKLLLQQEGNQGKEMNQSAIRGSVRDLKKLAQQKRDSVKKKLRDRQQRFLASKKLTIIEDTQNICIICRQSNDKSPLHYISKLKFTNLLNRTLLGRSEPFLMISTCGHKIHQECIEGNLRESSKFASKYQCFLCKKYSNMRLPIKLKEGDKEMANIIVNEMLTVLSVEAEQNPLLAQYLPKEKGLSSFLVQSLANNIYLYSSSHQKLFNARVLLIVDVVIALIKAIRMHMEPDITTPLLQGPQVKEINTIIELLDTAINERNPESSEQRTSEFLMDLLKHKDLADKLVIKIDELKHQTSSESNRLALNLFQQPKELHQLSFKARKCQACQGVHSKMVGCVYCGFVNCFNCRQAEKKHREECHLGSNIKLDLETGDLIYETSKGGVIPNSLYKNYAGESYKHQMFKMPKQNYYLFNSKSYDQMMQDALLDNVGDIVEQNVKNSRRAPDNCDVQ